MRRAIWCATAVWLSLPASLEAAFGPIGSEFQVTTHTADRQGNADIARSPSGGFGIVWESFGQDGNGYAVFGRRYDSSGTALGTEFQVNVTTGDHQRAASIDFDALGSFVVVWESLAQDASDYGVFGRRYDSAGTPVGTEFQINSYTTSAQRAPEVARDGAGSFMVVWQSYGQDGSLWGIFGQRFDSAGLPLGSEFVVNTTIANHQTLAEIAETGGAFVVTWESNGGDGSGWGILAQRYDSTGTAVGGEFQINTYITNQQYSPTISGDSGGRFVVTWASLGQDASGFGIFGQRFDSGGTAVGSEFLVNTYTISHQGGRHMASEASGNFVVVWDSQDQDGSGVGPFAQRFDSAGSPVGSEFQVNTYTSFHQAEISVAFGGPGSFLVVWKSQNQDGSSDGVFGQLYGSAPCTPAPRGGCRAAQKSLLLIKHGPSDDKDKLTWKWIKGLATSQLEFADPTVSTDYTLCIYADGSLEEEINVPADSLKWSPIGTKGFKYKDLSGSQDGVRKIVLKGSVDPKAKALVKGKGLALPDSQLDTWLPPITAQLVNQSSELCWEGVYDTFDLLIHNSEQLKAKAL